MNISRAEAEKIGKEQVAKQGKKYKFVRVGNLDECWRGHEDMLYYKKHKSLLLWRIDGAEFVSDQWDGDEGHWTKSKTLTNEKGEFWFVVADYKEVD